MESTEKRKPGRPKKYEEKLVRRELWVFESMESDAAKAANREGISLVEVYRRWIDKGRAAEKKGRK